MAPRSSSAPMANYQSQALATVEDLLRLGARLGARQVAFNAAIQAQRQAAQVRDLVERHALRRADKPAPHSAPANDHGPISPSSTA